MVRKLISIKVVEIRNIKQLLKMVINRGLYNSVISIMSNIMIRLVCIVVRIMVIRSAVTSINRGIKKILSIKVK